MKHEYEVNIGIEVHVQLATKSKIFCSSPNCMAEKPNVNICPVCAGYPGTLPVLNEEVIKYAVMAGLATGCTISPESECARKHYFYPDLPKGYQISQHNKPICIDGNIPIRLENGDMKNIRLIRIHLEEDAGKNIHAASGSISLVDLNRAGTPLLEIVSHPDISSVYETKAYLKTLRGIVTYLGICTGNMEDGALRADTNISVKLRGASELGTRCELKNINSFKFIGDAVEYEIGRQIDLLERGEIVRQETRSWDIKERKTALLRSKKEAADYRYFPDPDLPLIKIDQNYIETTREAMPELPHNKYTRLCTQYGLSAYEAEILIDDPVIADYYEKAAALTSSKQLINWILREVITAAGEEHVSLAECKVTPEKLAELMSLIDAGTINARTGQELLVEVARTGESPALLVKNRGLEQVNSYDELEKYIKEIIDAHPTQVAGYKEGKDKLFGFFVGQAMQKTKGKGNPRIINELLKKYLAL